MSIFLRSTARATIAVMLLSATAVSAVAQDVLPSWNDGANKDSIVEFVTAVTTEGGPDYVAPGDRIATFDNDGTLWGEQPMYVQLAFALDRVKTMAPDHPEWKDTEPFKSVLAGDMKGVAASGKKGLLAIIAATHSGMSTAEFEKIATDWMATARHPKTGKAYTEMVYQPMLELIDYLKANKFEVFIVSGGGIEFMRPWTEKIYGIPTQNVVGSSIKTKYVVKDGTPVIMREAAFDFIDDKEGKPLGINSHIGRRPIASFGNSGGDFQMLQWAAAGDGRSLKMLVFHDDADREYAYGPADGLPDSKFGTFPQSLMDDVKGRDWNVISMKKDWKQIYPSQ